MFLIIFSLFIAVLTVFENIFIWIILFGITIIWIYIFGKQNFHKYFIRTIIAFALAFFSVLIKQKQVLVLSDVGLASNSNIFVSTWNSTDTSTYFVGTWQIVDSYSEWRYIFKDSQNHRYFLNSENTYNNWDILLLEGYVQLTQNDILDITDFGQQAYNLFDANNITLDHEFDYHKRLLMKWIYGSINEYSSLLINSQSLWFLSRIRQNFKTKIIEIYWKNRLAWLNLWMMIWDRSEIPKKDYEEFIDSGLVHIIAVSWGNIIIVVIFLWYLLFRVPYYIRNFVILIWIVLYSFLCGLDSSVFRAMIMWGLWYVALFRWRSISVWRSLMLAYIIMLIINPYFLFYDLGFLLSFWAIIWIIGANKWAENKYEDINKFIKWLVIPTIWAAIGTLPMLIFFTGKFNLVSILANLIVTPLVGLITIYGFLSVFIYQLIPAEFILFPQKILLNFVYLISNLSNKIWIYLLFDGVRYKILVVIWLLGFLFFDRILKLQREFNFSNLSNKSNQKPLNKTMLKTFKRFKNCSLMTQICQFIKKLKK